MGGVPGSVIVPPGDAPIYAELSTMGTNGSAANKLPSTSLSVRGYRILRSLEPSGPFALVGEARGTSSTDTLLIEEQQYCYQMQSYNEAERISEPSASVCAVIPGDQVALPLL